MDEHVNAAAWKDAHNHGGIQYGQAGSSDDHAAELITSWEVKNNDYPRVYIE